MYNHKRNITILVLAIAIILSCTVGGNHFTDASSYPHTIAMLDKNRTTVLSLSAASAAASAALSALPGDICNSLSDELSEFTSWFLLILSVVYLEKYLLTILGGAACYLLIPGGCAAIIIYCYFEEDWMRKLGLKLIAFAAAILLVIPTSVFVSEQINAIYSKSIEATVESANAISDNLIEKADGEGEETSVIDKAKTILDDLSGSAAGVVAQFKNVMNRFIEATAVMIVTTCLIPLMVIAFFVWIVKTLFGVQIVFPQKRMRHKKHYNYDYYDED